MKKFIIYTPHKCGSIIVRKMLREIYKIPGFVSDKEFVGESDTSPVKLLHTRHVQLESPPGNIDINKDTIIFIPRNPAGLAISMYYSFGYSHRCPPTHDKKRFENYQRKIQKMGLENYVLKNIKWITRNIRLGMETPVHDRTVLPYELMVENFEQFLTKLLYALDMSSRFSEIYPMFEKQFLKISDLSQSIEEGRIKVHKRTTDIHEWKTKLSEEVLNELKKNYPFVYEYDKMLANAL